jgi:hypothetical protein
MSTEIKMWQIVDNHIIAVEDASLATDHLEAELENWIVERPEILGEDLLIIAKQKSIEGVGRLDLLGIDSSGKLAVVELKRGMTPREAVAQALDYASWLDKTSETEILTISEDYLQRPLEDAFADHFAGADLPEITPQNHCIMLVGSGFDTASERIINYLAQRYSVNINAVFFRYAKLANGEEILARSVLVPESAMKPGIGSHRKFSAAELMNMATPRQVVPMVEPLRALAKDEKYVWEDPATAYGGSFRFWRKNVDGKSKMVLGINVSGERRGTPIGKLDLWMPIGSLAEVLGMAESEANQLLQKLPVLEIAGGDRILRLADRNAAEAVAKQLRDWFDKYPGFYARAAAGATAGG